MNQYIKFLYLITFFFGLVVLFTHPDLWVKIYAVVVILTIAYFVIVEVKGWKKF